MFLLLKAYECACGLLYLQTKHIPFEALCFYIQTNILYFSLTPSSRFLQNHWNGLHWYLIRRFLLGPRRPLRTHVKNCIRVRSLTSRKRCYLISTVLLITLQLLWWIPRLNRLLRHAPAKFCVDRGGGRKFTGCSLTLPLRPNQCYDCHGYVHFL